MGWWEGESESESTRSQPRKMRMTRRARGAKVFGEAISSLVTAHGYWIEQCTVLAWLYKGCREMYVGRVVQMQKLDHDQAVPQRHVQNKVHMGGLTGLCKSTGSRL